VSDLISRKAAQKLICEYGTRLERDGVYEMTMCAVKQWAVDLLDELPSVEPERKPGKWIWDKRTGTYHCSECGHDPLHEDVGEIEEYKYCMNCGAKMEVDG